MRAVRAAGAILLAILILSGAVAPAAQQPDLAALLATYRTGDADAAVRTLALWTLARVGSADAHLASADVWGRLANGLLMREAAESLLNPDVNVMLTLLKRSDGEIADLCLSPIADGRLEPVCHAAIGVVIAGLADEDVERRAAKAFSGDPVIQTEVGTRFEFLILGVTAPRSGYNQRGAGRQTQVTSHGLIYTQDASEAEAAFRQALLDDPDFSEARVRLGHVFWLRDRFDEAEQKWHAVIDKGPSHPSMAYVAGLFLGRRHEDQKRLAEAEQVYRDAISVYPHGQAGRSALAKLLLSSGREAEGWKILAAGLPSTGAAIAPDPWALYALGDAWWARLQTLTRLRAAVRQ